MRVNSVSFTGTLSKSPLSEGRKQFEQLFESQRVGLIGVEKFRQKFNSTSEHYLPVKDTPLVQYVKYKVCIENAMKKTLEKFKWPK